MAQTTISYTSPMVNYQPFVDGKVTSWKAANDQVGQIGGWRTYAKEAQQRDNMPNPSHNSVTIQKPADNSGDTMKTDPHAGHKQ